MRKLFLAAAAAGALALLTGVVAFADSDPHGGFTTAGNSEDACAGCHRAHTADSRMLTATSVNALCLSCHNGSGAVTNVVDGVDTDTNGALNGGPLVTGATSTHDVDSASTTVPDSNSKTLTRSLTCVSCHDPHGRRWASAGSNTLLYNYGGAVDPNSVEQYRLLTGFAGISETVKVFSNETTKSFTATAWKSGTTQFCVSCHDSNDQPRDSGYQGVTRHPVDVTLATYSADVFPGWNLTTTLPLQHPTANPADDQVVCMTCHRAHGTTATMVGGEYSSTVTPADGVTDNDKTYLLRQNNRGICQDCHKK